ncbi:MAG: hypothetical protein KAJ73_00660 [Zetaproteobacteria bacterium]|nr:hypothetical protein [Zetaproteobacteria bacterium]
MNIHKGRTFGIPQPGNDIYENAKEDKRDSYYRLPSYVEQFIDQCSPRLPEGYELIPWTINRSISVVRGGEFLFAVTYNAIEDGKGGEWLSYRIEGYDDVV